LDELINVLNAKTTDSGKARSVTVSASWIKDLIVSKRRLEFKLLEAGEVSGTILCGVAISSDNSTRVGAVDARKELTT
jgi:hypothetical protein